MGWCSGTEVFDDIVAVILKENIEEESAILIISKLAKCLIDQDWDCECDSAYFDHPIVRQSFLMVDKKYYSEIYKEWDSYLEE